jgi:hypothetical protein
MEWPFPMYVIRIGQVWKVTWSGLRRNAPKQNQENTGFSGPDLDFPVALSSNFGNVALTCMHQFHSIPPLYLKKHTALIYLTYMITYLFQNKCWNFGQRVLPSGKLGSWNYWEAESTWTWLIWDYDALHKKQLPSNVVKHGTGKSPRKRTFQIGWANLPIVSLFFLQQTIFAAVSRLFLIKECALAARQTAFRAWKWKWNKNHFW